MQPSAASSQAKSAVKSAAKSAQADIRGAATNGYIVQVSAQRSKADAEASYRLLQDRFPGQLGARTAIIRRVDLGAKGIYYRAFVGSFASAGEADQFCGRLKAAGGQCFVTRN
jgi:cell division septation protein DedD